VKPINRGGRGKNVLVEIRYDRERGGFRGGLTGKSTQLDFTSSLIL